MEPFDIFKYFLIYVSAKHPVDVSAISVRLRFSHTDTINIHLAAYKLCDADSLFFYSPLS